MGCIPGHWREAVAQFESTARGALTELCAVIRGQGHLEWVENGHTNPEREFRLDPEAIIGARALIHSHPETDYPSFADMRGQLVTGIPWIIVGPSGAFAWGDELVPEPLEGRAFRFGVNDCYSLIRSWWDLVEGRPLPDFARRWEFWRGDGAEPMYEHYCERAGFTPLSEGMDKMRRGDVLMMRVRSRVANHGAVYLGGGSILHHPGGSLPYDPSRLSVREPLGPWRRFVVGVLRRAD